MRYERSGDMNDPLTDSDNQALCPTHNQKLERLWPNDPPLCEACLCEYYNQPYNHESCDCGPDGDCDHMTCEDGVWYPE